MRTRHHGHHRTGMLAGLLIATMIAGCSHRGWYEGLRGSARHECTKTQQECPPAPDYDQYQQQREELNRKKNQWRTTGAEK